MNKKCLLATICTTIAFCVLTATNSNAQVVAFSNDFEDGDLAAEVGSMTLVADSSTATVVPVTATDDGPDETLGSNVGLFDQNTIPLDLTLNLTDTLSLAGGNTVTIDFDFAARRTNGFTRTIFVDALDSGGNIVTRFVLGDSNAFGNGGNDRQRPGFATLADGNMIFGTPPGSFWWGADGSTVEFDSLRDAHMTLTIGASSFDFSTEGQAAVPFTATELSNYDGSSTNIAAFQLTSAGPIYGAYFDNLKVEGIVDDSPVLVGDVNCDGTIDFLDIGPFIAVLSAGTFDAKADIDNSTAVDFLDIGPFIALLSAQ